MLADNKLALNGGWDTEILAIELQALVDREFDVTVTSFSLTGVDLTLDQAREASPATPDSPADRIPRPPRIAVSRLGDTWLLGRHRQSCAAAVAAAAALAAGLERWLFFVEADMSRCSTMPMRHEADVA